MKKSTNWLIAGVCVLALGAYTGSVNAELLHVDVNGSQFGTPVNFTDVSGVADTVLNDGITGNTETWNYATPGLKNTGSVTGLKDATTGTATAVSIAWTANHYSGNNALAGTYGGLLGDMAYTYNGSGGIVTSTWTFSGLTGAKYDMVLYTCAFNVGRGAKFTVGGVDQIATPTGNATTLVAGDQYVRYNNLVPVAGKISFSYTPRTTSVPSWGELSGVEIKLVPEPSTIALLVTGLVGLLAYAWRKRK